MNRRMWIGAASIGSVLVVGTVGAFVTGQNSGRFRAVAGEIRRNPRTTPATPEDIQSQLRDLDKPIPNYTIEPIPVRGIIKARTQEQDQLFQEAAGVLSNVLPEPADRLNFFSWLDRADSPLTRYGWSGFVQDVRPSPAGWLITLWVSPKVSRFGGAAVVSNRFGEEYLWAAGEVQYVRGYPLTEAEPSFAW